MAVDQGARDSVAEVAAEIEAHKQVCEEIRRGEERWRNETRAMFQNAISELRVSNVQIGKELRESLEAHARADLSAFSEMEGKLSEYVRPLYNRFWTLAVSTIGGLFVLCAWLAAKALKIA